jgi:predicted SnoaL-like aldol condensation-catalyzing enzyme
LREGEYDGAHAYHFLRAHWHLDFKRDIAEGNLVALHSHMVREPGNRGMAVVDIFRLENGKIVEHWDVIQEVPEKSANNNTMF